MILFLLITICKLLLNILGITFNCNYADYLKIKTIREQNIK